MAVPQGSIDPRQTTGGLRTQLHHGSGVPAASMPVNTVVQFPARIDAKSASAMMTHKGELYVRVHEPGM